jgi:3-oxoacyl-(acyl-carrier-protein) synthase
MEIWITGVGQCSALGIGYPAFREALFAGQSGMARLPVAHLYGAGHGAPLPGETQGQALHERIAWALRTAMSEALTDAGLPCPMDPPVSVPVSAATNFGDHLEWVQNNNRSFFDPLPQVMQELGLSGELWGVSTACASGVNAIGLAVDLVRYEEHSWVLVCGYDLIGGYNYEGLASLHALSPGLIRPFDRDRQGTLLGEGVGVLVIEVASHAKTRNAQPHARLLGYGTANDGYHFTAPEPSGRGMRSAMLQALADAGITPEQVDHINAHGTGTLHNDRIETAAIHHVFGEYARSIPITATKPAIGHTMGAAGVLEVIAVLSTLRKQCIPPVLGLQNPALECDLDYVQRQNRPHQVQVAMSNSYGLWGCNASVLLAASQEGRE